MQLNVVVLLELKIFDDQFLLALAGIHELDPGGFDLLEAIYFYRSLFHLN